MGATGMLRGIIVGVFAGTFTVAVGLSVISLMAPLPAVIESQSSTVETTALEVANTGSGVVDESTADQALRSPETTETISPGADDNTPLSDYQSAPVPQTSDVSQGLQAPEVATSQANPTPSADGTVSETVASARPKTPSEETELSISTEPAQPTAPTLQDENVFQEADADQEITQEESESTGTNDSLVVTPTPEPSIDSDVSPQAEQENPADTFQIAGESLLKPAGTLTDKPKTGLGIQPAIINTDSPSATLQEAAPMAITQYAMDFHSAGNKPLMAIVLIDDVNNHIGPDALASFPYPLTYAIDTLNPNASARMKMFRDRGLEVMAMIDLPALSTATDVEMAMESHLHAIPQSVAVLEGSGEGLQGAREISTQVTEILKQSGHGLVMRPKGLNTAQKLASREGVPSVTVFRDFDGKGQNATVIRRFLDQAAFKARQEGGVVMIGRLRPETVSALLLWGLQDRANEVELAPVSAVLLNK